MNAHRSATSQPTRKPRMTSAERREAAVKIAARHNAELVRRSATVGVFGPGDRNPEGLSINESGDGTTTLLETALSLADAGYAVLPLVPNSDKRLDPEWIATTDPDRIREQWTRTPEANIGIATDRFFVLEIVLSGGPAVQLLCMVEDPPKTVNVRGPNNRAWFLYALPPGASTRGGRNLLGRGISVRPRGSYIVAPGSVVNGRRYEWSPNHFEARRPALAPEWMIERCKAKRVRKAS
jgi:hypothetical protein